MVSLLAVNPTKSPVQPDKLVLFTHTGCTEVEIRDSSNSKHVIFFKTRETSHVVWLQSRGNSITETLLSAATDIPFIILDKDMPAFMPPVRTPPSTFEAAPPLDEIDI